MRNPFDNIGLRRLQFVCPSIHGLAKQISGLFLNTFRRRFGGIRIDNQHKIVS
ncbi:hypothetical protein BH11ARM1_BH11ARM1_08750 [soil metagenome]